MKSIHKLGELLAQTRQHSKFANYDTNTECFLHVRLNLIKIYVETPLPDSAGRRDEKIKLTSSLMNPVIHHAILQFNK